MYIGIYIYICGFKHIYTYIYYIIRKPLPTPSRTALGTHPYENTFTDRVTSGLGALQRVKVCSLKVLVKVFVKGVRKRYS